MKRSPPPRRRTPLRARKVPKPTVDGSEPVSGHAGLDPVIYAAVVRRDGNCVGRGIVPHSCQGRLDPHHVLRKGQGGPDHEDNLILLCRSAHSYVHDHVAWSIEHGFLSPSWDGIEGTRAAAVLRRKNWP